MSPTLVDVAKLRELADPTLDWPWNSVPPKPGTVDRTFLSQFEQRPIPLHMTETAGFDSTPHFGRIAWFVTHGWDDPIEVDLGIPFLGYHGPEWPIIDGNHRLYAAIVRGDAAITAWLSGDVEHALERVGFGHWKTAS